MINYDEIMESLGLQPIRSIFPRPTCAVYVARGEEGEEAVKMPRGGHWAAGMLKIANEYGVLQVVQGIGGVPQEGATYTLGSGRNILISRRPFIPGEPLAPFKFIRDPRKQDQLEGTVRDVHSVGVAGLELKNSTNIVEGEDGLLYTVDFGSAIVRTREMSRSEFQTLADKDLRQLHRHFA